MRRRKFYLFILFISCIGIGFGDEIVKENITVEDDLEEKNQVDKKLLNQTKKPFNGVLKNRLLPCKNIFQNSFLKENNENDENNNNNNDNNNNNNNNNNFIHGHVANISNIEELKKMILKEEEELLQKNETKNCHMVTIILVKEKDEE